MSSDQPPVLVQAMELHAAGLAPIYQRGKCPFQPGWNRERQSREKLIEDYRSEYNVGVVTGQPSRLEGKCLIVLDCDIRCHDEKYKSEAFAKVDELVPGTSPTTTTGGGGTHTWLWLPIERLPERDKVTLAEGPMTDVGNGRQKPAWQIEVLLSGHACTCPPSIHPSGGRYEWTNGSFHIDEAPPTLVDAIERASGLTQVGANPSIVALTIDQLLSREFPPMEAILSPWLRKQNLVMVYSARGVGKTHFGLGVAYAVAGGGSFLKWRAERPRKVLYIDGEMSGAAIRDRLAAIVRANPADHEPSEDYFRIVTPDAQQRVLPDLGDLEGRREYDELLQDAELVVLDNLSCLVRSGIENEGESWLTVASWMLARRREGRAVLFFHHGGKNGTQRGSSRREDMLDVVIKLKRPGNYTPDRGAQFEVEFEKARALYGEDVREIEATLTQGQDGTQVWVWRGVEGATEERVVEMVKSGMSNAEIAAALNKNRTTIFRARKRAEEAGKIDPRHGNRAA